MLIRSGAVTTSRSSVRAKGRYPEHQRLGCQHHAAAVISADEKPGRAAHVQREHGPGLYRVSTMLRPVTSGNADWYLGFRGPVGSS